MTNRLAAETSPYLLQHAENPVDWFPWGDEAFARARMEDKPILLSIGYSSCHWCHVMAHESFEDERTAALMNASFVNIKVDREERPDVDSVYMSAVQALTGSGGWPMTVFMDASGRPFYAGTYFPPDDGHGRPGFGRLLQFIAEKWKTGREEIFESAEKITAHLQTAANRTPGAGDPVSHETTGRAVELFGEVFDMEWGGFGTAPKFPSPSNLAFLLAVHSRQKDSEAGQSALEMVLHTLRAMATGGMYDQLGGGFARYSVDAQWVVPHFEKMLYDNAQLARVYLNAYQLTGDPGLQRVVRETLNFLLAEMRDPAGGFYAALDADSEGIEGKFYVWTADELKAVVRPEDVQLVAAWFGVTTGGNFHDPHHPELTGRNVLTARADPDALAQRFGTTREDVLDRVEAARSALLAARAVRVRPGLDDKVLTSWNGLALAAFAEAARVLQDGEYRAVAVELATFLRDVMWQAGRLRHTWKGGHARVDGMLEDYTYLGLGLFELFKLTGEVDWLEWARELWAVVQGQFRDDAGGYFETPADGETLLLRQKAFFDAATPSGNGSAALLGLWLARYFEREDWERAAEQVAGQVSDHLRRAVTGFGTILQAIEFLDSPSRELVIVGSPARRAALETAAASRFLPWVALAPTPDADGLPMFEGREPVSDDPLAYVCENMMCLMPARTPEELLAMLS